MAHYSDLPQVRARFGFTLVELLIVIATIAVLVSILFPVIRGAVEKSRRASCIANLHQIAQLVEAYRQDYAGYPAMPNYVGLHGIPQGGVTGVALANAGLAPGDFWCDNDPAADRLGSRAAAVMGSLRDSTYAYGYNYYGYVVDTDGLPFPITSEEAANFFYDDGKDTWRLDLVDRKTDLLGNVHYRPRGLFQGLWNVRAPEDTLVTFCAHHPTERPKYLNGVTIGGVASSYRAVTPKDDAGSALVLSGFASRRPSPGAQRVPPIDWRLHKAPLTLSNGAQNNELYGDALGNESATHMPVVEVYYRQFTADMLKVNLDANGHGWYDTGLDVKFGDVVMVVANARWAWAANGRAGTFADDRYAMFFNDQGLVYFTADGDPVEAKAGLTLPSAVMSDQPHCRLIGKVGDAGAPVALGSRASLFCQEAGTLRLTMNDTNGAGHFSDNVGWCELWVAVYRQ